VIWIAIFGYMTHAEARSGEPSHAVSDKADRTSYSGICVSKRPIVSQQRFFKINRDRAISLCSERARRNFPAVLSRIKHDLLGRL